MTHLNQTLTSLTIDGLSHDGRGIARFEGKAIFIPNAVPGDVVTAKVRTQNDQYDEASLLNIVQPSPHRATPFCAHYAQCGGCQLQHLSIDAQRFWKNQNFITRLTQAVDSRHVKIAEPIFGQDQGYRRRARLGLAISKKDKVARLGFRQKESVELVDINHCPILSTELNQAIQAHKPQLLTKASRAYKEITVVQGDNGVFGLTPSEQTPHYRLNELTLEFLADGFIQINGALNTHLVNQAIDWLKLTPTDTVLDLFCGIGNFTLPIAQHVQQVIGVEGEKSLVESAQHNAELNHKPGQLSNATFYKADLFTDVEQMPWFYKKTYQSVLLVPGRQGAFELC
jgi:23S rRNA (uracil1939-C5)-methyltransferase